MNSRSMLSKTGMLLFSVAASTWAGMHTDAPPCIASAPNPDPTVSLPPGGDKNYPDLCPFKDELQIPVPAKPYHSTKDADYYRIEMRRFSKKLHSDMPKTCLFGYDGLYPGPTFDIPSNRKIYVDWVNNLGETPKDANDACMDSTGALIHPVKQVAVAPTASVLFPQDWPGSQPPDGLILSHPSPPLTVVHLHGGTSPPGSDGWPDDCYGPGISQTFTYPGESRGALLWYHDHAVMITRLNVLAGLAGLFIVRGPEERFLEPLTRAGRELPLLIQDRNFEIDPKTKTLSGVMLQKLAQDMAEFYGPYTLVNGSVWPYCTVKPQQYRLRLLNGSNGRFYRLRLRIDDQKNLDPCKPAPQSVRYSTKEFTQIGTDSGLLDGPVEIPSDGLIISPAERADIILDLRNYKGKWVSLVNDYPMPLVAFDPMNQGLPNIPHPPRHPEVLQFRVSDEVVRDDFNLNAAQFKKSPRVPVPTGAQRKTRQIYLIEDPPGSNNLLLNGRSWYDGMEEVVRLWRHRGVGAYQHHRGLPPDPSAFGRFRGIRSSQSFDPSLSLGQDVITENYKVWRDSDPQTRPAIPSRHCSRE